MASDGSVWRPLTDLHFGTIVPLHFKARPENNSLDSRGTFVKMFQTSNMFNGNWTVRFHETHSSRVMSCHVHWNLLMPSQMSPRAIQVISSQHQSSPVTLRPKSQSPLAPLDPSSSRSFPSSLARTTFFPSAKRLNPPSPSSTCPPFPLLRTSSSLKLRTCVPVGSPRPLWSEGRPPPPSERFAL